MCVRGKEEFRERSDGWIPWERDKGSVFPRPGMRYLNYRGVCPVHLSTGYFDLSVLFVLLVWCGTTERINYQPMRRR